MDLVGSKYEGDRVNGRMEGSGKYMFENGDYYVGEFKDGMFNGKGTLFIKGAGRFDAEWKDGLAVDVVIGLYNRNNTLQGKYTFSDGLEYEDKDWKYCTGSDRRFYNEYFTGIKLPE